MEELSAALSGDSDEHETGEREEVLDLEHLGQLGKSEVTEEELMILFKSSEHIQQLKVRKGLLILEVKLCCDVTHFDADHL